MSDTISSIAQVIDSLHSTPQYQNTGYSMVRVVDINNEFLSLKRCSKVDEDTYVKHNKNHHPQRGDIIITRVGSYGMVGYVDTDEKFCLGQNLSIIHPQNFEDGKFLYYYILSPFMQKIIYGNIGGSAYKCLGLEDIRKLPLKVKGLKRREIGEFLYRIDKKINTNNSIIEVLESMAKTLYDYWFVQFDFPDANGHPYKTSGGKMEWNETLSREIPAGWEVDNLFRIASYVNGLACQKYRPQGKEESLPVIKIREMHEGVRPDTERVSANIPLDNVICDGDILFSWSATLEIQYWTGGKAGLNQHIFKVIPFEDIPKEYVYHQLKEYIVNFVKIAEARKTTMGHITQDHLKFSRIVIPPYEVLRRFEERMKPIHKQMVKCNQENRKLISLRDFLLPMLMNGQVTFRQ